MRYGNAIFATAVILGSASSPAIAQREVADPRISVEDQRADRDTMSSQATRDQRAAKSQAKKGGVNAKDGKLINEANTAAQAKADAGDFPGAIAIYDQALAAVSKDAPKYYLLAGKAVAQRRQGIAAYNAGGKPQYPQPGAGNDAIRAANAANTALQARKVAAAVPMIKTALTTAVEAATAAEAAKDAPLSQALAFELRESAALLYRLDPAGTFAGRPSAQLEANSLRKWIAGPPAPSAADLIKYGYAVAAVEVPRDRTAGLALADEVQAKGGTDTDAVIAYADFIAGAKLPAGDPRRAKATAAIFALETGGTTNDDQKAKIRQIKAALTAPA